MVLVYAFSFLSMFYSDSKTLKEEKREELFESLKADATIGWAVDVIDPRVLSAKMLQKLVSMQLSSINNFLTVQLF